MQQFTRRTVLGLAGTALAAGVAGGASAKQNRPVERLLSTGSPVPENIGFDADGDLYVGITGGSVRRLLTDRTDERDLQLAATTEVATYPGDVAGVVVADGTLYTAVNGDSGSVYAVELGDGGPSELATILPDGDGFVNDIYPDGDRLLVTESFGGTVYEVSLPDGEVSVWAQDDLLDTQSFGANGITRIDDTVYVAVTRGVNDDETEVGRIVQIPVAEDGSAGTAATYVEDTSLFGADGLTARGPQLYVAVNAANRITRVTPSGNLKTVVEESPLSFPSEVVFDPTDPGKAFVCNFSPETPDAAGVLRTRP